jgi:hypothetical protein
MKTKKKMKKMKRIKNILFLLLPLFILLLLAVLCHAAELSALGSVSPTINDAPVKTDGAITGSNIPKESIPTLCAGVNMFFTPRGEAKAPEWKVHRNWNELNLGYTSEAEARQGLSIALCALLKCADVIDRNDPYYDIYKNMQEKGQSPEFMAERYLLQKQMDHQRAPHITYILKENIIGREEMDKPGNDERTKRLEEIGFLLGTEGRNLIFTRDLLYLKVDELVKSRQTGQCD